MSKPMKFSFKHDLSASFVVFLVSMPLCLGIAVASGAPTISGIIGGVIGGIVVGFLGGSPLLVSGPANGLLVLSWDFIQQHGFALFLWSVFLAGLIQIAAGSLKIGQFFRAVTPGVILGLMSGFAVVILSGQLLGVVGLDTESSVFENFSSFFGFIAELLTGGRNLDQTIAIGLGTLALLVSYDSFVPKSLKLVPAALLALIVSTSLAFFFSFDVARINIPENIFTSVKILDLSLWATLLNPVVIKGALLIAFIASAETLLCATAVDKLHKGPRTHYNRELLAQGLGNTLSGVFGGIPITGVIIRSSTNVLAGAKSKWSNIFSGIWLFTFVAAFPFVLAEVPRSVLAAVLIHSVTKLIRIEDVKHLWDYDRFAVVVFAVTALGVVFFGVLSGVAAGLLLSTLHSLQSLSRTDIKVSGSETSPILLLGGAATFFRIPQIATALEEIDAGTNVVIEFKDLLMVDFSVFTMLQEWEDQHLALGGSVTPRISEMVDQLPYVAMQGSKTAAQSS